MKKSILFAFALLLVMASCKKNEASPSAKNDNSATVYYNGDILTMEGDNATYAEAVVVKDGKITFLGSKDEAMKQAGQGHAMVDLEGKTLMPGFIDPHLHPNLGCFILNTKFATPFDWSFPWGKVNAVRGHKAFIDKIKEYANEISNPTEQLIVWGYMEPFHGEMSRKELDGISTTRPIMVWQYSAHEMIMNTAALQSLGITEAQTKGNSQIFYDKGRFVEAGFFNVVVPKLVPTMRNESVMKIAMGKLRDVAHMGGITTLGDMGTGSSGELLGDYKFIVDGLENDETPFRMQLTPDVNTLSLMNGGDLEKTLEIVKDFEKKGSKHILINHAIKLYSDGAFFGQAFQVLPPGYLDGHTGEWIMDPKRLHRDMKFWWDKDYPIHIHCNGSLGLSSILDELEILQKESPKKDHRLTIEHFGQSSPAQSAQIARLGAVVSANPYYLYSMGDKYVSDKVLGKERGSEMVRLGSLVKNKVPFALHSDFTMAPIQPLLLAWIAANRVTADGTLMAPQEKVSVYNALQGITSNAAYMLRLEKETGSIKVGKKADFVILAENPLKIDPIKIKDIKILETVFEGKAFPIKNQ
ncbi:amidohydrolase [Flavobacterium nackdongense]|uniref:Amidohydrolase n=1 Tax=Flavobacterium nackdongense TaxID=2547394 RepID=A0A4P6YF35_9FLAO|nr:amidohydrolase [Flavobacterium nackdongense]QBN19357.1 amidohydrolase [Flavobacterium nackdongense]